MAAPTAGPAAAAAAAAAAPTASLLEALLSGDEEVAAAAAERLCDVAKADATVQAALGANPRLTGHLRGLLAAGGGGGSPAGERLQMYAAYLVSILAGKTAGIDAALLDQRLLPVLVAAAGTAAAAGCGGACGWGVTRGALRAVAKLLEAQPACAAAQLLACGGVRQVAAMLDSADSGALGCRGGEVARFFGARFVQTRGAPSGAWRASPSPACLREHRASKVAP